MRLSKRNDGPEVVIDFDEPVHIDQYAFMPKQGFSVWTRWRNGQIVGFGAIDTVENCKRSFWDACLIQYVGELRSYVAAVRN